MEQRKKAVAPTIPKPFNFHQPKPSAKLRTYMDDANQVINPTLRMKRTSYSLTKASQMWDPKREEPATTKKHEAYVAKRREQMVARKTNADLQVQEELVRMYKQNRLQQRVKCSPALVSTSAGMKKTQAMTQAMARKLMHEKERRYEQIKAGIEYKVANRPLLVEQVSKAFIHNLNQIKELQRYVQILRDAGMNPDEHLTEEQRELLVSAEYYDRLNLATAYFPTTNVGIGNEEQGTGEEIDDQGEGQDEGDEDEEDEG